MATEALNTNLPLIVIVGPTASGKTALAIELADRYGGEIICADSRTVYKGMDIGTAKPTPDEQIRVPHWGLDLVEPGERFTAADFKQYATQKMNEIRARGRIPFLVGGTGLYVDGVVLDYQFGKDYDPEKRRELEQLSLEQLCKYCFENNIELPQNLTNKRYVIRAIEQNGVNRQRRVKKIDNCIVVGIATDMTILRTRIERRAEQLLSHGVVDEAILLGKKYGWQSEAMTGNIYPLIKKMVDGTITEPKMLEQFVVQDYRLAKRQMTWLRRHDYIEWMAIDQAEHYLSEVLEKTSRS